MPIIDGQKMACEPCIRGHRSTKCNHAKERLMVPVRKPGRPLSVCPHPPNKPCSCAGVTAAIPRAQKCGCGTSDSFKVEPKTTKGPGSPTRRSFHVQKPGSKQSSRIDAAGLERTDASHLNFNTPPSWNGGPVPIAGGGFMMPLQTPPAVMAYPFPVPNEFQHAPSVPYEGTYVMTLQHPIQTPIPPASTHTGLQTQAIPASKGIDGAPSRPSASSTSTISSCCAPASSASPRHTPTSSTGSASASSSKAVTTASSCCSNKPSEIELGNSTISRYQQAVGLQSALEMETNGVQHSQMTTTNGAVMPAFTRAPGMPAVFPSYFQPPGPMLYTYPATYGTVQAPLQLAQWKQTISSGLAQALPSDPLSLSQAAALSFTADGTAMAAGTSHMCSCGDSCNCLGCPAHPYNEATQDYVRSAMDSMMEHQQAEAHGNGMPEDAANHGAASGTGSASPQQAQTPSDASGVSEDQAQLSANDFFFVTYPFGQCGGETMSCPCGDDCQCVGCLIHNSGSDQL